MNELKEIGIALVKSPVLIPTIAAFLIANQQWLFPQIPKQVVESFLNLLTMVLVTVGAYYAGKTVRQKEYQRAMLAASLAASQRKEIPHG